MHAASHFIPPADLRVDFGTFASTSVEVSALRYAASIGATLRCETCERSAKLAENAAQRSADECLS